MLCVFSLFSYHSNNNGNKSRNINDDSFCKQAIGVVFFFVDLIIHILSPIVAAILSGGPVRFRESRPAPSFQSVPKAIRSHIRVGKPWRGLLRFRESTRVLCIPTWSLSSFQCTVLLCGPRKRERKLSVTILSNTNCRQNRFVTS